jgi:hypothetical protein
MIINVIAVGDGNYDLVVRCKARAEEAGEVDVGGVRDDDRPCERRAV